MDWARTEFETVDPGHKRLADMVAELPATRLLA